MTVLLVVPLVLAFGGAQAAAAAPDAAPPVPSAPSATIPPSAPNTPASILAITSPSAGSFSGSNSFTLEGTRAEAGSTIAVTAVGDASVTVCATTTATQDGLGWRCTAVGVPNGHTTLTAKETLADSSSTTAELKVEVLGPPTLDGPGSFVTPGIVSGGAREGATVAVTVSGGSGCSSGVSNRYWSCSIAAGSGTYTVTAHQSDPAIGGGRASAESPAQHVTVDKDRPEPPIVTSPKANARVTTQPVTFTGRGEALGFLDLYIDASPVCGASVDTSGNWSCQASGVKDGQHAVQAIQRDLAGNFSSPSAPIRVYFGQKEAVAPPVTPTPNGSTPTPSPTPSPSDAAPPLPPYPDPRLPAQSLHEALTNWGTPTGFGSHLPTVADTVSRGNWLSAIILALGFIALIALPLRLLATTLRGRLRLPRAQLLGRNRVLAEPDVPAPVNPWLAGAIPFAAAVALIVLSGGINGEVRYLRLTVAVGLGLAILNVGAVAIVTRLSATWQRAPGRLRFIPALLFVAAAAAVLSRLTGIDPPFLAGVLIGVTFAGTLPARRRAMVGLVEIGTIVVFSMVAWLVHGWMAPVHGFWATLTSEMLATVCLAGLGSAVVLVLPIAALPGRALLEWSPPAWLGTMVVVVTLAAIVILGDSAGRAFPLIGTLIAAAAFAAVSLATWSWVRFVEPEGL